MQYNESFPMNDVQQQSNIFDDMENIIADLYNNRIKLVKMHLSMMSIFISISQSSYKYYRVFYAIVVYSQTRFRD